MQALLICDDLEETVVLRLVLQRAGLTVSSAATLDAGLKVLADQGAAAILLASRSGSPRSQVLRVRQDSSACLLVLSSSTDEDELVEAYDAGADLVTVRPFSARLLISQLRALLRRSSGAVSGALPSFVVGSLRLDPAGRMVQIGSRASRRLTQLEYRLLHTLMMFPGQTVPTETIVERVWGFEGAGGMELVRGLVRRLRGKVEADPRRPQHIITDPGIGYRLEMPEH